MEPPYNNGHGCHYHRGDVESISNVIVSSKIYDKRDDFNFEIVNLPFFDEDVPWSPSYGIYILQLIRFARVCSNIDDYNNRNLFIKTRFT